MVFMTFKIQVTYVNDNKPQDLYMWLLRQPNAINYTPNTDDISVVLYDY